MYEARKEIPMKAKTFLDDSEFACKTMPKRNKQMPHPSLGIKTTHGQPPYRGVRLRPILGQ